MGVSGVIVGRMRCRVEACDVYDLGILDSAWRYGVQARGWEPSPRRDPIMIWATILYTIVTLQHQINS